MDDQALEAALSRAERALARIERSVEEAAAGSSERDEALRAKVRDAIAELDQLIQRAEA